MGHVRKPGMQKLAKNVPGRVLMGYRYPEVGMDWWLKNNKEDNITGM